MVYPNPYFFFRPVKEADLLSIALWMGGTRGLSAGRELGVLRQLKKQHRDPENAGGAKSRMAVVGGKRAFLLELTPEDGVYLTGLPAIHANPWQALEVWGRSIPYLFLEEGLEEIRVALPDARTAEIRALKKLGCRRMERDMDSTGEGWVWVCGRGDFRAG